MENNVKVNLNEYCFRLVGLDGLVYEGDQRRTPVNDLLSFKISI
jgi:hypothetical protein